MRSNEILRILREELNMSQGEVAKYLGIPQQTYSKYERGCSDLPIRHLTKLVQLFNVNADYILGLTTFKGMTTQFNETFIGDVTLGILLNRELSLNMDGRREVLLFIDYLQNKQEEKQ